METATWVCGFFFAMRAREVGLFGPFLEGEGRGGWCDMLGSMVYSDGVQEARVFGVSGRKGTGGVMDEVVESRGALGVVVEGRGGEFGYLFYDRGKFMHCCIMYR